MYQVIYADPPWSYSGFVLCEGDRKDYKKRKKAGEVKHHYTGMSTEELKNLEINPYQVIYADPPWKYPSGAWTTRDGINPKFGKVIKDGTIQEKYPTMSTEELKNLGIDPYQVVYSDPPWHYKRDFEKALKTMGIGFNNANKHYGDMSTEELKNLGIDPYQVVYSDPPWFYNRDIDKANVKGHNGGKGIGINTHYESMSTEELKNLGIDPYQVVYSDPPWSYRELFSTDRTLATRKWDAIKNPGEHNYDLHYSGMPTKEISALPIKDIVAKDAACFMWTTDAHMPSALEIMKAWGFQYKTIAFIWIKKTKNNKQIHMLAPWTLKGAEICLLGTRGAMTKYRGANNIHQVHEAVRREHSRKPDIIRDEIARMFPDCRKIELFARTAMPGWDAWGNEVEKFSEPEKKKSVELF